MTDYEHRKAMWLFLSGLFSEVEEPLFVWIYSKEDACEANRHPDGVGGCCGVVKGVV